MHYFPEYSLRVLPSGSICGNLYHRSSNSLNSDDSIHLHFRSICFQSTIYHDHAEEQMPDFRNALAGLRTQSEKTVAMEQVLDQCLEQGILVPFIREKREAIIMHYVWEYDEKAAMEAQREEGREEERAKERAHLYSLVQKGYLDLQKAAAEVGLPVEEFEKQMIAAGFKLPDTVS